ncbi:glycosyltransferase [Bacillus sp. NPDC077027]|uniref:glycosyltransferase n=1 Tax=Bacillus sp. NPDC077027 TaxID=3390548 RepID=UPI003D014769
MFQKWMSKKDNIQLNQPNQNEIPEIDAFPDMDYYFITDGISEVYSGFAKSVLLRMERFGEQRVPTTVLTCNFDANYYEKVKIIAGNHNNNPKQSKIINMYEDYIIPNSGSKRTYSEFILGESVIDMNQTVLPKLNKTIQMYTYDQHSNVIQYVDLYNEEQQLMKREEYDRNGSLRKVQSFIPHTGNVYLEEFIKNQNEVFLEKIYSADAKKNVVLNINWYTQTSIQSFPNKTDLRKKWLTSIQHQNDRPKLFLVDSREQDRHVFKMEKRNSSYYAAFIHGCHYNENKNKLKPTYQELFKQVRKQNLDAVFFTTKEQKEDVEQLLGEQPYFYLSPPIFQREISVKRENVDHQKAMTLSSLVEGNIKNAIKAFRLVVDELPQVHLDIYGSGEEEAQIKAEIKAHSLENHVFLKGSIVDLHQAYQTSRMLISTSSEEGIQLPVIECIYNGCPIVAYDVDYSIRSFIKHDFNGYAIEQNDIQSLAQHIIALFQSDKEYERLSANSLNIEERFSPSIYDQNWSTALNHMIDSRLKRDQLRAIMEKNIFFLYDLQSEHHVLHLELKTKEEIKNVDNVQIDFAGYDRMNGSEIISQTIDESNKVSFPMGHFQTKKNLEVNQTKYVDFYIRFRDGEGQEMIQRLEVKEDILTNKPSKLDGLSYETKNGYYSWSIK